MKISQQLTCKKLTRITVGCTYGFQKKAVKLLSRDQYR